MLLYEKPKNVGTRWASFENPKAEKGAGAMENRGGKGCPSRIIQPNETAELMNYSGSGVVRRIWATVDKRSDYALRSLLIRMYWDESEKAAVSAPLGDFFGRGAGGNTRFFCEFFENPEGRSFNCFIPMPFRTGARITLTNEYREPITLFYDIDFTVGDVFGESTMYFHAFFYREHTRLMKDFEILPAVRGFGRFLGANFTVIENPAYPGAWFGEGEVKIFLDGDTQHPTLAGTGTEDYIGTAWGQGTYAGRYQGCPYHGAERREWAFYRYHVVDPVYFDDDCRVTLQQMGGAPGEVFKKILENGAPYRLATAVLGDGSVLMALSADASVPNDAQWYNFYREDDVAACAYFYLGAPATGLPEQTLSIRTEGMADV